MRRLRGARQQLEEPSADNSNIFLPNCRLLASPIKKQFSQGRRANKMRLNSLPQPLPQPMGRPEVNVGGVVFLIRAREEAPGEGLLHPLWIFNEPFNML